jgi:multiple sugar transport system permease protein
LKEEEWYGIAFFLRFLLSFFLFIIYPLLYGLMTLTAKEVWVEIFKDAYLLRALLNTLFYVGVAVNVKMILAFFLSGLLMYKDDVRLIKFLEWILIIPWALPDVTALLGIKWMFNTYWGTFNILLNYLSLPSIDFFNNYFTAMFTIIYTHIWKFLPLWTLILYSVRLTIPREIYEAAEVDGASDYNRLRFITLPLLRNTYVFSTVLSTIWVMGDFTTPWLLTGGAPGGSTHVAATIGYFYAFLLHEMPQGLAANMTLLPLILFLLIIAIKLRG